MNATKPHAWHRQLIPPLLLHAKQFLDVNGVVNKIFYKKGDDAKVDALVARANGSLARFAGAAAQTQQRRPRPAATDPNLDITDITDDPYTVAQAMLAYFHKQLTFCVRLLSDAKLNRLPNAQSETDRARKSRRRVCQSLQ